MLIEICLAIFDVERSVDIGVHNSMLQHMPKRSGALLPGHGAVVSDGEACDMTTITLYKKTEPVISTSKL